MNEKRAKMENFTNPIEQEMQVILNNKGLSREEIQEWLDAFL